MNVVIFKCSSCMKMAKEVYLTGCIKCKGNMFVSLFAAELRKRALEAVHGTNA